MQEPRLDVYRSFLSMWMTASLQQLHRFMRASYLNPIGWTRFLSLLASIIGIQTYSAELPWVRFLLTTNSGTRLPWGGRMLPRPGEKTRLSGTRETARTTKSTKTVLEFIAMAAFADMIWRQRWGWTVAREAWRSKFEFAWRHICMFGIFAGRYCQPPPQGHPRVRPDKWPGAGWTIARCDWHNLFSKTCLWLVLLYIPMCCCLDIPRNLTCTQTKWSSLQLTTYYAAVVLVWTFRQLCGWINMREKMLSGKRTAESIGRMCGEATSGATKCFEQIRKEKRQVALKRSPGIVLCVNNKVPENSLPKLRMA